jgi:anti-sigma28 factor (negative regulator of flagellin synthesis)
MCISKEDLRELIETVAKVKHDTGNIRQTQQALGGAVGDIETHLKKLNSRTSKVEHKVENLEDPIRQGAYCVQRDNIEELKNSMLTIEKFEDWERRKEKKREDEEKAKVQKEMIAVQRMENKQRKMEWIVGAIVGAGTFIIGLLTLFV